MCMMARGAQASASHEGRQPPPPQFAMMSRSIGFVSLNASSTAFVLFRMCSEAAGGLS